MANQLYGHSASSYGGGAASVYTSRSAAVDPYLPTDPSLLASSRYHGADSISFSSNPTSYSSFSDRVSSMLYNQSDTLRYSAADIAGGYSAAAARVPGAAVATSTATTAHLASQASWSGIDVGSVGGIKRSSEALYHQTLLGAYNTIGQSDAWFSTNPLVKRPRFETASNLPIYPQRPGEKDCAHYMLTRTCKFGDSCKFDHPIWVPEGGIPDWKEVPLDATTETLPERPGEPDCPYFLKTQKCKYGLRCKFNHPKDKMIILDTQGSDGLSNLPDRPSEPPCAFYMKTGKCKFGATCKFHHPKDIQLPPAGQDNVNDEHNVTAASHDGTIGDVNLIRQLFTPALFHNTKGLPIRPGEVDCPFYLKTGSCKYGATCRYNHPERYAINPSAAVGHTFLPSPAAHLNMGVVNPAASILQTIDPRFTQATLGLAPTIYPQRPGQIECDYYMKTGECKFGERCKFHHPIDRSTPSLSTMEAPQQNVKLTLAGLPRREGAVHCPYYMKTGACKYGATCKFDHPPPGEVMAMATSAIVGEGKEDDTGKEQQE